MAPNLNPGGAVAPQVPKPGLSIPVLCEQRLTLAMYGAYVYNSIGRTVETHILNRARLNKFKKHRATVDNHDDPETLPDISKSFTVMKFLDQLPTYLCDLMGVSKVALSYVIREQANPPNPLPALRAEKPWSDGFTTMMEELVAFTPHDRPNYEADNAQVYSILSHKLSGSSAMTSITKHQRTCNRRGHISISLCITWAHQNGRRRWK